MFGIQTSTQESSVILNILKATYPTGGGGSGSISAGTNIDITRTLDGSAVNLQSPLTSTLNIGSQNIVGSGISINSSSSLNLITGDNVTGSGQGLTLSGNTIMSDTSGTDSGKHLALTINGVVYKITLLNE